MPATRRGIVLLVVVSAALHTAALPPWGFAGLAWVALVPFFAVVERLSPRGAAGAGLLWGVAAHWGQAVWILPAMADYYQQPLWFAGLFGVVSSLVFRGLPYALFAAVAAHLTRGRRGAGRSVLVALTWVAAELLRARGPTGDPWLLLGYALTPHPLLLQAADAGGVYLLSFVVALVNAAVAECAPPLVRRPAGRALGAAAAAVGALGLYGAWRLATPLPAEPAVPVAIVQGNVDLGAQWKAEHYGAGLQAYLDLSRAAAARAQPQILVWPESAVTFFLAREPRFLAPVQAMLRDTGSELVTGAPHLEDADPALPRYFNSAFAIDAGGVRARYDKERLLPFAEYFPLRFIDLLRRRFDRVRAFTPGAAATLLPTRLGPTAVVICFEAVFPELVRARMRAGAVALVNLSNDAWLGSGSGPAQHLAMVVPRAVENRTWVVRATTTGISAVIDPFGRVLEQTSPSTAAVLEAAIVPLRVDTFYERWGDWFAWLCAGLVAGALVGSTGRGRGARAAARPSDTPSHRPLDCHA